MPNTPQRGVEWFPTAMDCALVAIAIALGGQWRRVLHTTDVASELDRSAGGGFQKQFPRVLGGCLQFPD